ncbi:nuclear elongation and deformation protein 1 [Aspergillus ellipticus CBS 707.79]|uniref:Nuclear elongation and deformation protein 1 n=1 Tax=Aspergillus ellipticus CBS 707.79 TaxID=1448320 RepID=A0A319DP27_9EURO|nr:nuclear elongation and deformation protein 1 [Aspergillus ellipticus CBS 707.79]
MQYVRSISGSVSKTWNSINPATLSGAIDVIVIEQEDGTLACSPFHVRFGKFSLLRPYEKKVEFRVNGVKQGYAMKLGEGGEAFFVFETTDEIPAALQTSPLVSPTSSPKMRSEENLSSAFQEPEYLDLDRTSNGTLPDGKTTTDLPLLSRGMRASSDLGTITPLSRSPDEDSTLGRSRFGSFGDERGRIDRMATDSVLLTKSRSNSVSVADQVYGVQPSAASVSSDDVGPTDRSRSPPPVSVEDAMSRAVSLSKKLTGSNIPSRVTDTGDLVLDMTGYKSNEEDALRAEVLARKILSEELEGNYDIGALIGADEHGNLWIYSSEEAKEAANRRATFNAMRPGSAMSENAISDPGYHSDSDKSLEDKPLTARHYRTQSDVQPGFPTLPQSPPQDSVGIEPTRNYAKTLRLTSNQLKALNLKPGANEMSFSVNRATCMATMYLWNGNTPIVISDIDGTITKSDALGHVLNMIGRDWTHAGVAKLYTDIANNGYNIMYLTSRSVGQADTTRAYVYGVCQDGFRLPKGPVITSPDRMMAALRREIYLRKPEVFKMACLRDILGLFNGKENPFYAGFGNRLTDALSYRSVNIPSTRIFTINSNAEVSLDLLSLNKYKSSYVSMSELLDHFFPPVSLLVQAGGEEYTDFTYWREPPPDLEDFSCTDSEAEDDDQDEEEEEEEEEDYDDEDASDVDETGEDLGASYISQDSVDGSELADGRSLRPDDEIEASDVEPEVPRLKSNPGSPKR